MKKSALFLLLAFISCPLFAIEISLGKLNPDDSTSGNVLTLRGEIKEGDYKRMLEMYNIRPVRFQSLTVALASEGGDMLEAIKIGNLIKNSYQSVFVSPKIGKCASACFLIYVAAVNRDAIPPSIGIHRPFMTSDYYSKKSISNIEAKQKLIFKETRKYLESMDVPQYIIEKMFSLSSNEIYWLTDKDLVNIARRPSWYDQLLVDRCGLNKSLENGFLTEGEAFQYAYEAKANLNQVFRCESEFTSEEGISNIQKLLATEKKTGS